LFTEDFPPDARLTVLLTGGRAPCTLELARSFHAAGHRVLVAESIRYHLCRVSRAVERSYSVPSPNTETGAFLEAIEAIVASEQVDVLIPTCEEIFFLAKGLDRLRKYCRVWASPIEDLRELHDKWRFILLAQRLGLQVPPTELVRTQEEWLAYTDVAYRDESLVLKPAYSRFASRIIFLDKEDSEAQRRRLLTSAMPAISPEIPWIAQRRIQGQHICTYSVAVEGELVAHGAYPCVYRAGQGATVYFEPVRHVASLEWVRRLVRAVRFTGQIAFDFIEEEGGALYAIECNPRATSGIHLFGGDTGLVQAFLQPQAMKSKGTLITPKPSGSMLTVPLIAAGLSSIRSFGGMKSWLRAIRSARDVVSCRGDRRPVLEQLRVVFHLWRIGRTRGITLTQATTMDLEWNGEA
jgi:predicted ATP-grasp superfamily ATP-dependent carboligase